jgi:hypothetical protein
MSLVSQLLARHPQAMPIHGDWSDPANYTTHQNQVILWYNLKTSYGLTTGIWRSDAATAHGIPMDRIHDRPADRSTAV